MYSVVDRPTNATCDWERDPDTIYNQPSPLSFQTPKRSLSPEKIRQRKKETAYAKNKLNLHEILKDEELELLIEEVDDEIENEMRETEQATQYGTNVTSRCSDEMIRVKKEKAAEIRDKSILAAYTADEDIEDFRRQLKILSKEETENSESDDD